jgi:hypothetical protein
MRNWINLVETAAANLIVTEGRRYTYSMGGEDVETIDRPSRLDFEAMLARSQYKVLRAMLTVTDLIIWDAAKATHDHPEFGGGERIVLTADMVLYYPDADESDPDYEEELDRQEKWIDEHPMLKRIYGGSVRSFSYYEFPNLHIEAY